MSQLTYHISAHLDKRQFKCQFCNSGFNRKSTLKIHNLTHIQNKPFKCLYCSKTFSQKSNLKKHTDSHILRWFINTKNKKYKLFSITNFNFTIKAEGANSSDN